jgi:hypothetical protein
MDKHYHISYDSWEGYYIVHTERGEVRFYKEEHGLPYIDLDKLGCNTAIMQLQSMEPEQEFAKDKQVQLDTAHEEYTKKEVLKAKEARCAQAMIENPSEGDY